MLAFYIIYALISVQRLLVWVVRFIDLLPFILTLSLLRYYQWEYFGWYGPHRLAMVAMVTIVATKIPRLPCQLWRYFSCHGNHGNTLVAMVTVAAIKILRLPWQLWRYFRNTFVAMVIAAIKIIRLPWRYSALPLLRSCS